MLSYKEYKQLNESLYGAFNLGIKQNNVVAQPIGATGASDIVETEPTQEESLEEAKKVCKCGKMMKKGMDCECEKHDKEKDEDKEEKDEDKEEKDEDKEEKDEDKEEKKGLTAAQKKLPKALQDAILKKQGKKEWTEVMADVESLLEDIKNPRIIEEVRKAMIQVKEATTEKTMTDEEKSWWDSVNKQLAQPQPGDLGFAPVDKITQHVRG